MNVFDKVFYREVNDQILKENYSNIKHETSSVNIESEKAKTEIEVEQAVSTLNLQPLRVWEKSLSHDEILQHFLIRGSSPERSKSEMAKRVRKLSKGKGFTKKEIIDIIVL